MTSMLNFSYEAGSNRIREKTLLLVVALLASTIVFGVIRTYMLPSYSSYALVVVTVVILGWPLILGVGLLIAFITRNSSRAAIYRNLGYIMPALAVFYYEFIVN